MESEHVLANFIANSIYKTFNLLSVLAPERHTVTPVVKSITRKLIRSSGLLDLSHINT